MYFLNFAISDLVLRKRLCVNVFKRPSITSFFRKNLGNYIGRTATTRTGVTFEIVNHVPDIQSESQWFAQIEADLEDEEDEAMKDTFIENYTKSVTTVESFLVSERFKQSEMLSEMIQRQEEMQELLLNSSLKKTSSMMNMNIRSSNLGLNNFGSSRHLSSSQCSLDVTSLRKQNRLSLSGHGDSLQTKPREHKRRSLPPNTRMTNSTKPSLFSGTTITEEE